MDRWIMMLMALGALLGGADRILGNRFGLGEKFEEGFALLGSVGLSMAGIICLAPLLSSFLGAVAAPALTAVGLDPGMLGGLLAIDMGGYPLAMELARDASVGRFAGIVVSAVFGCTIVFTIPVGLEAVADADRPYFSKGVLVGLTAMPAALVLGGMLCGLPLGRTLGQLLPVFGVSVVLLIGMARRPEAVMGFFGAFAKVIRTVATLGLTLGAVSSMTGWTVLPGMMPLADAMKVVCAIGIVMLGSLPLAELTKRALRRPLGWIGRKTGLNAASTTGLLVGVVSVVPALVMLRDMDDRGKVVNSAAVVCGASAFAAHLGFAVSVEPELVGALLAAKLFGAALGALIALFASRKRAV